LHEFIDYIINIKNVRHLNFNLIVSMFARSLATMNSSRRKVCRCVGIILFDSNLPVLLSAVGVVKYRCTVNRTYDVICDQ